MYSEVYGIIESMGLAYKNAIPKKLYQFIYENRDEGYSPQYDLDKSLATQGLSQKATAFICFLHYKYWCKTEDEKQKISKILEYNEKKNKEKYDVNNIFKQENNIKKNIEKDEEEQIQLVEYKENVLKKMFRKLKEWFSIFISK